jgi:hypothetical protein
VSVLVFWLWVGFAIVFVTTASAGAMWFIWSVRREASVHVEEIYSETFRSGS